MQAIKAIYDGVNFNPMQAIPVSGQYEVIITFVEQISASPNTVIFDDEVSRQPNLNEHAPKSCHSGLDPESNQLH